MWIQAGGQLGNMYIVSCWLYVATVGSCVCVGLEEMIMHASHMGTCSCLVRVAGAQLAVNFLFTFLGCELSAQ